VSACETSCGAWVLRAIYQKHAPQCSFDPSERFPCPGGLKEVRKWTGFGQRISLIIALCGKGFLYLVAVVDLFPACTQLEKNSRAALTRNSALEGLGGCSCWWEKAQQIFHSDSGCQLGFKWSSQPPHSLRGFWDDEQGSAADGRIARLEGKIPLPGRPFVTVQHKHRVFLDGDRQGYSSENAASEAGNPSSDLERVGSAMLAGASIDS